MHLGIIIILMSTLKITLHRLLDNLNEKKSFNATVRYQYGIRYV